MKNLRSSLKRQNNFLVWFLLGVTLTMTSLRAGEITGRIWPAALPMTLASAVEVDGQTVFSGSSSRLRPGCSPLRLDWHLGVRGGQFTPAVANWLAPIKRPNGGFSFSGWTVNITPVSAFLYMSHADVIHQCRILYQMVDGEAVGGFNLPWETKSPFWN